MSEDKEQVKQQKKSRDIKGGVNRFLYSTGLIAAKTVAGVGVGAVAGVGAVVALASAEITLPALLVMKTFGFAGGAVGFLRGLSKRGN